MSEDNKTLKKSISLEEVRLVLFNMNSDKSLSLDRSQTFLDQKCWEIFGVNLWKAIEASKNGGSLLSKINYTFLTLIPKKDDIENLRDFRPTDLCNTIYKILPIFLANRLNLILPKIILEE